MSAQLNSAQLNLAQLNPAPSPPLAPSSLLLSPSTGSDYLPFSALRLRLLFTLRPCALGALHVPANQLASKMPSLAAELPQELAAGRQVAARAGAESIIKPFA